MRVMSLCFNDAEPLTRLDGYVELLNTFFHVVSDYLKQLLSCVIVLAMVLMSLHTPAK